MDKNEAVYIINMLVGLVYELYPDEEYAEMYGIEGKIEQAKKFVKEQA